MQSVGKIVQTATLTHRHCSFAQSNGVRAEPGERKGSLGVASRCASRSVGKPVPVWTQAIPPCLEHIPLLLRRGACPDRTAWPTPPLVSAAALAKIGKTFLSENQNQRGALTLLNGILYVPYGGALTLHACR